MSWEVMPMIAVLLLALSVSVDACAAALSVGLERGGQALRTGLRMAGWFGGFQTGMSLLGGLAGGVLSDHVQLFGAVFAFGLLLYLGGTQALSALSGGTVIVAPAAGRGKLLALALATSLDALAVGVSLPYLGVGLAPAALVIGLVTFLLTLLCGLVGGQGGGRFQRGAAVCGGIVLMLIGVKILLDAL